MAIEWGGTSGNQQVGIDIRHDGYNTNTPSINVYIDYYVRSTGYGFNDNQTLTAYGSAGGAWNFLFKVPANSWAAVHVGTLTLYGLGQNYNGGPYYAFGAVISGSYNGGTPRHERGFTLPARPANVPTAPTINVTTVTSSSARVNVGAADGRGSAVTAYQTLVDTDAAFNPPYAADFGGGSATATGLARATTYYAATRARNGVGWGPWSNTVSFKTGSTVPDAPARPTVSGVLTDEAEVQWKQPGDGGSKMSTFDIQVATDAGFTQNVKTHQDSTSPTTLTGLMPGSTHYVRVRGINPVGNGVWSPPATFDTLTGALVKVAGKWVAAKAYVKVSGTWRPAKIHKRAGNVWHL